MSETPIKCRECATTMNRVQKDYHYNECGLPSVLLTGITVNVCPKCGAEAPEIPAMAGLHRQIMLSLLKKRSLLCGEEIRFLRKMSRMKATELAVLIGADATSLSKWENNERKISAKSDRVIRLVCYTTMLERLLRAKSEEKITGTIASVALAHDGLNIVDLLKHIENKSKGPKKMSIDPSRINDSVTLESAIVLGGVQ